MQPIRIKRLAAALSAAVMMFAGASAHAAEVHWKTARFQYAAEGKNLKDVLRDFAASQGIAAAISPEVDGTVSGKFDTTPQRFANVLASSFGFVWYFDGAVLEVTSANEVRSVVVKLQYASTQALRDALKRTGIADDRFPITYDDQEGTALVAGPPRYVELVNEMAKRIDQNQSRRAVTEVRVFPLHAAWAADHDTSIDGRDVTIPGVATVMASLYGHTASGGSSTHPVPRIARVRGLADVGSQVMPAAPMYVGGAGLMPPLPAGYAGGNVTLGSFFGAGAGATGLPGSAAGQVQTAQAAQPQTTPVGMSAPGSSPDMNADYDNLPVIEADPRTNSILVRDLPERMESHQELISHLDIKPKLIEIEAHIIDINDSALAQLGIDWRAHNSHADLQIGNGQFGQANYDGNLQPTFGQTTAGPNSIAGLPATPLGGSITAVLGDAGRFVLARVNALQTTDQARIEASPKVTTLDNIEALMNQKQSFFVRVPGTYQSDLYNVSAGVTLRVLPMVVENDSQIKLDVHIEDGQINQQITVDNIPTITNSEINTQAFIGEGQSLLIAGYKIDQNGNSQSGVPVLSKIPVLGNLFKYHSTQDSHMERLFLLTPRVIEPA
ncbi:type III secretion system outer membrane ring subunit SctC [Paraburkholderia sp. CI3]|uniref:type III secretion system outer membrane ring subunit SctC n=1 Tax=Paraburkholderia sp. CI3 TaxID=2991060 RepID=UPI003D21475C